MIKTVTLNPALDCTVNLEELKTGGINRAENTVFMPGGKGINVSLLLSDFGLKNTAIGAAAGFTGLELIKLLTKSDCRSDFIVLNDGATRLNIKTRTASGEETDINLPGPEMPVSVLDRIAEKLSDLESGDMAVFSGSLPPGLPEDSYAYLLSGLAERKIRTIVDTSGSALLACLLQRPFLIKPNVEELSEVCGKDIPNPKVACECAHSLQRLGARNVAVTMGERGALLVTEGGYELFCQSIKGETVSTVGAGDSFIAGFIFGIKLSGTIDGALQWGVTAGAATAFSQGIASADKIKRLYKLVGNAHPLP